MKRITKALVALPIAALLLGGCSASPRDAAIVNGKSISVAEVDRFAGYAGADNKVEPSRFRTTVLNTLIVREFVRSVGAPKGKPELVQAVIAQSFSEPMMKGPHKDFYQGIAEDIASLNSIPKETLREQMSKFASKVTVNPLFGKFDPETISVGAKGALTGSLSRSVEELNPSAAPQEGNN